MAMREAVEKKKSAFPMPAAASFLRSKKAEAIELLDTSTVNKEEEKPNYFTTEADFRNYQEEEIDDDDSEYIEEDIIPGAQTYVGKPYDMYQVPVSGGLPIKMVALDVSKRPFTPPFA